MDNKELRSFLIKRFILTLFIITIAEYGLIKLLSTTLIPITVSYVFKGADINDLKVEGFFVVLLAVTGSVILEIVNTIVPYQIGFGINQVIDLLKNQVDNTLFGSRKSEVFTQLSRNEEIVMFLSFFTVFIVILIPYFVGAFLYARMVIREFKLIDEREKEKAREFERRRNLMLSDIAHDLRTPMTTVSGYSMALLDGMVEEDKKLEYLTAIQTKSKRMSDLINLLFDYVKLDSDGFELTKQDVDICEMVRECVAFQYQDFEDAGMELDIDIPEEQVIISADKLQLSRVITNLLTNTIRHNEKGTKVGLYVTIDDEEIRIMVADDGEMIERDYAEHIFEPFVVGDESRNSRGGTGLGLSIAKKVVEMHKFSIKLTQKPVIKSYDIVKNYTKMFMIVIPRD